MINSIHGIAEPGDEAKSLIEEAEKSVEHDQGETATEALSGTPRATGG